MKKRQNPRLTEVTGNRGRDDTLPHTKPKKLISDIGEIGFLPSQTCPTRRRFDWTPTEIVISNAGSLSSLRRSVLTALFFAVFELCVDSNDQSKSDEESAGEINFFGHRSTSVSSLYQTLAPVRWREEQARTKEMGPRNQAFIFKQSRFPGDSRFSKTIAGRWYVTPTTEIRKP